MKKLFKILGIIVLIAGAIVGIYELLKKLGIINCCKLNCDDCDCCNCDCECSEDETEEKSAEDESFDSEEYSSIQPKSDETPEETGTADSAE